jgi:hypothetical protein
MMYVYKVPLTGTGQGEDALRPDMPEGISWVGGCDGTHFLVKSPTDFVPSSGAKLETTEAITHTAQQMGFDPQDVLHVWAIGGEV